MGARAERSISTSNDSMRDRRGDAVIARVKRDFESGIRAGVVSTPTLFTASGTYTGEIDADVLAALSESR